MTRTSHDRKKLGERLRSINNSAYAPLVNGQFPLNDKQAKAEAKARKELDEVTAFFDEVKSRVTRDITANRKVATITLGKRGDGTREVAWAVPTRILSKSRRNPTKCSPNGIPSWPNSTTKSRNSTQAQSLRSTS